MKSIDSSGSIMAGEAYGAQWPLFSPAEDAYSHLGSATYSWADFGPFLMHKMDITIKVNLQIYDNYTNICRKVNRVQSI
jgi:hypothetical protein